MKNIFKKPLKFISSRLFYLVIGIFLAIGATYVYATWDQAKTGGSGQLTETNWNELVTMIENNIAGGRVTWKGYTASTYNGNMGGVRGMNAKCDTNYTGSHACTWDEIIKLGTSFPGSTDAWVVDGALPIGISEGEGYVYCTKDLTACSFNMLCGSWTSAGDWRAYGPFYQMSTQTMNIILCNIQKYIPCCK